MKEIRPIYSELQGYLSQAPDAEKSKVVYRGPGEHIILADQLNTTIDELNKITSQDYSKFKINVVRWGDGSAIHVDEYRSKLSGLISRLHGEYFFDQVAPFSGMPTTIINQSQAQTQSMNIQILLDLQSKIDEKLKDHSKESKEKTFLENIKTSLSHVKDINELLRLVLETGKNVGLSIEEVMKLFS